MHLRQVALQEVWVPTEPIDLGAGFGRQRITDLLVGSTPWADLEFRGADGQPSVVLGMHVQHKRVQELLLG